jgi:BlaI family transcriptional regulator, penicillinase repressor
MKLLRPSDLELQVLSVLWDRGPSSVRGVLEAIPDRKQRAYTTILSVMQVMEKKGLLGHTREGLSHIYHPLVQREQVLRPMMKDLLRNVFGGSPSAAVQFLLDQAAVDDEELAQIRRTIREHGRKHKEQGEDQ